MAPETGPVVLIVRDGWGENPHPEHDRFNAVHLAETPVADRLGREWPSTLIKTSGEDVGLPDGVMGNSEVGHQNIGAGRIVDQEVMRITRAVRDGTFFENPVLRAAFEHARETGGAVHLLGLVSDGQVHSDIHHLFALVDLAVRLEFPGERLFVHAITDGRDTGPKTGLGFIRQIEEKLAETGVGKIATVSGRYWAMDRDNRWGRVARAYAALTGREVRAGSETPEIWSARSAEAAIERYYDEPSEASREGDEFIVPTRILGEDGEPIASIGDGDAVIFFNFRGDRPRELTKAFKLDDETFAEVPGGGFERGDRLENLHFCTLTGYETGLPVDGIVFEKPPKMPEILGQVVSERGLRQFRCAETEKYPHVTFFFNDYRDQPFPGETQHLLPSPKEVSTYDQKPEMSAHEVCEAVLERVRAEDGESFIVVNFANPDMVGHTGKLEAIVRAVEVVDACVGRLVEAVLERGGALMITADHGNAEQTWDPEHEAPHTAHTTYDVPLYVVGERFRGRELRSDGRLADVAPTLLEILGLEQPAAMDGHSLLE